VSKWVKGGKVFFSANKSEGQCSGEKFNAVFIVAVGCSFYCDCVQLAAVVHVLLTSIIAEPADDEGGWRGARTMVKL
jgi:hypothetical protein